MAFYAQANFPVVRGGKFWSFAVFTALVNGYMLAVTAPAAVAHSSQLLGFAAAAALFGAVGFSVVRHHP